MHGWLRSPVWATSSRRSGHETSHHPVRAGRSRSDGEAKARTHETAPARTFKGWLIDPLTAKGLQIDTSTRGVLAVVCFTPQHPLPAKPLESPSEGQSEVPPFDDSWGTQSSVEDPNAPWDWLVARGWFCRHIVGIYSGPIPCSVWGHAFPDQTLDVQDQAPKHPPRATFVSGLPPASRSAGQVANVLFPAGFTCGGTKIAIDKLCELATKARTRWAGATGRKQTELIEDRKI